MLVSSSRAKISAIGTYVPARILSNAHLEQLVDTNHDWIMRRTGIRERRIAAADEFASDLAAAAIRDLAQRFAKPLDDVELLLVCTTTPDFPFPSVACILQHKLGLPASVGAMDISAACAGFVYGLHMANALISSGLHRKIIVVAAETLSKTVDYTDRTTAVLFGDGAGAVLVECDDTPPVSFLSYHLGSEGSGGHHVYRSGLSEVWEGQSLDGKGRIVQNGREVYRWATRTVAHGLQETLRKADMQPSQVDWFVPHSANLRMIESICEKSGFPIERTLHSVEYFGNTSAASIPLAIDLAIHNNKIKPGNHLLLYGFGAGLVHAGLLLRLQLDPETGERCGHAGPSQLEPTCLPSQNGQIK